MKNIHWVSTSKMTFEITVENGIIVDAAPIAYKFIGQPFENLRNWMIRQGGFQENQQPSINPKKQLLLG